MLLLLLLLLVHFPPGDAEGHGDEMPDLLQTQQVMFLRKEILIFQYSELNGCDVEFHFSLLFISFHTYVGESSAVLHSSISV